MNGKALMLGGIRLGSLEASDMLDVVHYLFEEDNNYTSGEHMDARSKTRESIYQDLYGRSYKFGAKIAQHSSPATEEYSEENPEEDEDIKPFNPRAEPTKPFVAPTQFNPNALSPFGDVLDSPM